MSKSGNRPAEGSLKGAEVTPADPKAKPPQHPHGVTRETLESIAFAFVLALLFRTFAAEAFVIPTGSMAPTLYGRNKDVICPACGLHYAIGASEELDDQVNAFLVPRDRIAQSMCPNCREMHNVYDLPVFKGDRILVNKAAYLVNEPHRWDVIVFRYPEDTQKNYIKRLVGLPGETIRIERGDVYARPGNTGEFKILRKDDPNKQQVVQQVVYDDRHAPHSLLKAGWPEAWLPEGSGQSWAHDSDRRVFEISATETPQSVRYQHLVPSMLDWNAVDEGRPPNPNPRPQLVSDFCGYNSYTGGRSHGIDDDRFWVGDLTFTCTVNVAAVSGAKSVFTMELNEGVRRYRCHIDVATGMATLTRNDDLAGDANAEEIEIAKGQTTIKGPGKYELRFANVDDRLCLWVNPTSFRSGLVTFNAPTTYDPPANRRPQDADLRPVAFSAQGMKASVGDLLVERDIYYRAERVANDAMRYSSMEFEVDESLRLREALVDPQEWGEIYDRHSRKAEFTPLESDEFFVMGDNSPRSQDSRLWPNEVRGAANRHAVNRTALIGKAFFIYWPHAVPFMNNGRGYTIWGHSLAPSERRDKEEQKKASAYAEYTFPFYPQWWRWKRIR